MTREYLWTKSKARLELICTYDTGSFNWLFLPGGPGLGSESLSSLIDILELPGSLWQLDFPGDGSNTFTDNKQAFQGWSDALVEATRALKNVVLVAHSRGGMFALATPTLQRHLKGIVLMSSAPDMSWQKALEFDQTDEAEKIYRSCPTNAALGRCVLEGARHMFFTKEGLKKGIHLFQQLPYNYESFQWAEEHFDPTYRAQWVPEIPTLILTGDKDQAIPLKYFQEKEEYQRPNILMKSIENAGHFPWLDGPQAVIEAFKEYILMLLSSE